MNFADQGFWKAEFQLDGNSQETFDFVLKYVQVRTTSRIVCGPHKGCRPVYSITKTTSSQSSLVSLDEVRAREYVLLCEVKRSEPRARVNKIPKASIDSNPIVSGKRYDRPSHNT